MADFRELVSILSEFADGEARMYSDLMLVATSV